MACQSFCIVRPQEPPAQPSLGRKVRGPTVWASLWGIYYAAFFFVFTCQSYTRATEKIHNINAPQLIFIFLLLLHYLHSYYVTLIFLQCPNRYFRVPHHVLPSFAPCPPSEIINHSCPFPAGERVLASGSVQLPRFTLLESGSLLISPSHLSDAGTYTCMASNSRGIDEASADLVVWGKLKWSRYNLLE